MNKKIIIKEVENYVKKAMRNIKDESHGYRHVDRVRKWALKIGRSERGVDLFLLEVAALLHDVGRSKQGRNINHYSAGEKLARAVLKRFDCFSPREVELICRAVLKHGAGGKERLVKIIQDADKLDLLGAVVVLRLATYHCDKPHYIDQDSFKLRKLSREQIGRSIKDGSWDKSIIDNLTRLLSTYNHIHTQTAKKFARVKHNYLKKFILQFKKETIDL